MLIANHASDYYYHQFRTKLHLQQFKRQTRGIMDMRLRLYFDQFGQIPVPLPPVDEQWALVNFYNNAMADTDHIINQTYQGDLPLARRPHPRLITDIVTGRLAVREVATQDLKQPIPVVFPLSSRAIRRHPLVDWLVEALNEQYDVLRKIDRGWIEADQILPLLDGLEEVVSAHRAACVAGINAFR